MTQVNLSRIYAHQGKTKDAVDRFVQAVKAGYSDLDFANRDPDLAKVRTAKSKDLIWNHYSNPDLQVVMVRSPVMNQLSLASKSFEIKNAGTLPLVNATITCGESAKNSLGRVTIPYLHPGESFRWSPAFSAEPVKVQAAEMRVNPDNRGEIIVTNIHIGTLSPYVWGNFGYLGWGY